MSLFPSVGSTVTEVRINKSGTLAKVKFDDGCNILVKYEALVIDDESTEVQPRVHKESVVTKPRVQVVPKQVPQKKPISESAYKEMAQKALSRQQSRAEDIFSKWEHETGQFDQSAGPIS